MQPSCGLSDAVHIWAFLLRELLLVQLCQNMQHATEQLLTALSCDIGGVQGIHCNSGTAERPLQVSSLAMQMLDVHPGPWTGQCFSLSPHLRLDTSTAETFCKLWPLCTDYMLGHHQPLKAVHSSCTVLSSENRHVKLRPDGKLYKMEMPSFLLVHSGVLLVVVLMMVVLMVTLMALVVAMLHLHGMSMLHLAILQNKHPAWTERLAHNRQHKHLQKLLMGDPVAGKHPLAMATAASLLDQQPQHRVEHSAAGRAKTQLARARFGLACSPVKVVAALSGKQSLSAIDC